MSKNKFPPIPNPYQISITENAPVSTVIFNAAAQKPKKGLIYTLAGEDANFFNISSEGVVTFKATADFELKSSYAFEVVTTAAKGAGRQTDLVVVTLANLNDSAPVFTSGSSGAVAENAAPATVIYSATTTDADNLAARSYTLGGADAALLDVTAAGVVTLKASPDFETKSSYSFNVIANDGANSTTQAVVVSVINTVPEISAIALTSASGASNGWLNAGDVVSVTLSMTEATSVTGSPTLALNIGGNTVLADYASGSGSQSLVFEYTIVDGESDLNGIRIDADSVNLDGGTLGEASANAVLSHGAVADDIAYRVDTTAPTLVITSSASILAAGETAQITFTFSEDPGISFVGTDISVSGGTLGSLSGSGLTRSAVFTAASTATLNTGATIVVAPGNFSDQAGNTGDSLGETPGVRIATVFNQVLFVGNSATFGRADPVLQYNTFDAVTNPGGVHDMTAPVPGTSFENLYASNLYEPHPWGGVPGLFDKFADQVGLNYDVSLSTRNAATLFGHYTNSSPQSGVKWDLRGNIASEKWDMVVLQDQTDEPLPSGAGSITFAAGSSVATLVLTPNSDAVKEYDETVEIRLSANADYRLGTTSTVVGTIVNDDPTGPTSNPALPTVSLATSPGAVLENGPGRLVYVFTRSGSDLSADLVVNFTTARDGNAAPSVGNSSTDFDKISPTTGTATSPYLFQSGATQGAGTIGFGTNAAGSTGTITIKAGQTTATLTLSPTDDATLPTTDTGNLYSTGAPGAGDESLYIALSAAATYNVGTLGKVAATIVNDDFATGAGTGPNITLALASASGVYESASSALAFAFTRSGDTSNALTVNFDVTGNATYFASDATKSDFSLTTTGASSASLVTTSGANADIPAFQKYANLIEDYIHTGAADSTTIAGTTIAANANADASTDVYLYATWARPDMIAGAWDMVTTKTADPSGNGAWATGVISQLDTQATAYFLSLEDMSAALTTAYTNLASVNPDFKGVAPVSSAFMAAIQNGSAIRNPYTETSTSSVTTGKVNLWFDDNLHASKYGSYLAGLTLFETMTGLDAQALGAGDQVAQDLGIDSATAVALQKVASATLAASLGFNQSFLWTGPGVVNDLGGTGAAATLAAAGAYTFVDGTYVNHSVGVQAVAGNLGSLSASVRSDGSAGQVNWIYTVNNQILDPVLDAGQHKFDRFVLTLDDGHGNASERLVEIELVGVSAV